LKKYKKAEKVLKFAEPKFNSEKANILLLFLYFDIKNYNNAIKILHGLEEKGTSLFKRTNFYLGLCYDQLKNFEQSEKYLLKAIEENPQDHEALNYLGYLYADKGINLDKAEELVNKALQLDPTNYAYIDSLGWVYYKKGLYEKAEEILLKAAEGQPDSIIYEHVGDVKAKLNKYDEAIEYYNKSLKMNKNNKELKRKIRLIKKRCKS
jgi:tetratricopeptide (TPR) repeat protein